MNKPTPKIKEYYDFFECRDYIKEVYLVSEENIQILWSDIVDLFDIGNGSYFYLDIEFLYGCSTSTELIIKLFIKEFGDVEYHVWW